MNKFNEYEVVQATRDLSDKVHEKATGTVLYIFVSSPFDYLIEFMEGAESLGTLMVNESDLRRPS